MADQLAKMKVETKAENLVFQMVARWAGLKVARWVEMMEKTKVEK